jgi:hypothetical protein
MNCTNCIASALGLFDVVHGVLRAHYTMEQKSFSGCGSLCCELIWHADITYWSCNRHVLLVLSVLYKYGRARLQFNLIFRATICLLSVCDDKASAAGTLILFARSLIGQPILLSRANIRECFAEG